MSNLLYPDWWRDGALLVGADGIEGTLRRSTGGGWTVEFTPLATGQGVPIRRYMHDPLPRDFQPKPRLVLSEVQINQVTHDADRAFLAAIGRGMRGSEWASVPDGQREQAVFAAPLTGDGYANVRKQVATAIKFVLNSYL